jgi:hypothetical protein
MASRAMSAVVNTLLEQVRDNDGLRSLLVETEEARPRLKVGGQMYVVGLVDDKPMLMRESDRELLSPDAIGSVTEIVWRLE